MRWEQFDTLMAGGARMPEPGFALALYAIVTGDAAQSRKAVDWAMQATGPVRDLALVYDWCRPALSPQQSKAIEAKLAKAAQGKNTGFAGVRDRVFAAVALGDADAALSERVLREIVVQWWRGGMAREIESGRPVVRNQDLYPLFEILHAIRDNLTIDLRTEAHDYFKALPPAYLLGHYPAPYPAAENDYRIPSFSHSGEPNIDEAAMSRAAGLSMVAYDNNATDSQFLQGYLLMDHFIMKGGLGSVYEYLWANPYQPGLSYYHFPLSHHDPRNGLLYLRASWEDDATWFGLVDGQAQLFNEGKITVLDSQLKQNPIEIGAGLLVVGTEPIKFEPEPEKPATAFVIGLPPHTRYNVETDDEELWDVEVDPGGTVAVPLAAGLKAGIRISKVK